MSAAGSSVESACQLPKSPDVSSAPSSGPEKPRTSIVVSMQAILPYTLESFTREVQDNFRLGVAAASSVGCKCQVAKEDVNITDYAEAQRRVLVGRPPTAGTSRRATNGLVVDVSIAMLDSEQSDALLQSGYLSKEKLNTELAKVGVSPISRISKRRQA